MEWLKSEGQGRLCTLPNGAQPEWGRHLQRYN